MNFPRRSLSASIGSWCLQLVYDPRSAESQSSLARDDNAAQVEASLGARRALLPAFIAIFLATAAACYALAHFIALPVAGRVLSVALLTAVLVSWGARCGAPPVSRICGAARWPLAFLLAVCALSLRWSEGFAQLLEGQPNMQAAVFSGFITLLSVLLIGARSGGRLVPVAAPLVPALSLLGLLCLVAVDGITQACFLVFSAAALYLLCYDHFLRRAAPDLSSGVWNIAPRARPVARGDAPAWALQSVLVSSVWFALFLGGGALLFWPLQAVLPGLATPRWNRGQGDNGERKLDYSGGAPVMELRGGTHTLSDKTLLRVTPLSGVPTGTWRGRIYENYERSLWSESEEVRAIVSEAGRPLRLIKPRDLGSLKGTPPTLGVEEGGVARIRELVVPLGGVSNIVYSSGFPLRWQPRRDIFNPQDPERINDSTRSQSPYEVRSFETRPSLRVLDATPGFDPRADNPGMAPELRARLRLNLRLPDEPVTRAALKAVAAQVQSQGANPSQKARAVAAYLRGSCLYSLQAPVVPATADATVYFLTDARRGACDMFASSMALLLREMGVPARVATGFLDPRNPESILDNGDGSTSTVLRERDSHAWVEYYVPKYGWLSIDPTEGARELPPTLSGQLADLLNLKYVDLPPTLLALPLLGLALVISGLLWQRRTDKTAREHENERQRIEAAYNSALRLLRRRVPHAPHLTPGEYETRVARAPLSPDAKQEFAALTHLYRAARYGSVPAVTVEQTDACLTRLKAALKRGANSA